MAKVQYYLGGTYVENLLAISHDLGQCPSDVLNDSSLVASVIHL